MITSIIKKALLSPFYLILFKSQATHSQQHLSTTHLMASNTLKQESQFVLDYKLYQVMVL